MTDLEAVDRLEAFIAQQRPAVSWTPVTDYSLEARRAIEGEHPRLICEVFQPRCILDAGCGPEAHLVRLLRECQPAQQSRLSVWGFDPQLPAPGGYLYRCSFATFADHLPWPIGADLVICREVLEHLPVLKIRQAVATLVELTTCYVYVTTRFHSAADHMLAVADHDDLDPTHISLPTQAFLRLLFVLEGCRRRADLEARIDWQHKGRCLVYEKPAA